MDGEHLYFEVSHVVAAPVSAVWEVIGDFGTEHRWTRTLLHCERGTPVVAVGTSRTCTLPRPLMGRSRVSEVLTEFDPGVSLAYDLDGAAGPFLTASSRWSTRASGDTATVVTVEGCFTPRNWSSRVLVWPVARLMVGRLTRSVLRDLGVFVAHSTGQEAPRA